MLNDEEYIEYLTCGHDVSLERYNVSDKGLNTKIIFNYLPYGINREGILQDPHYIVIHETSTGIDKAPEYKNIEHYTNKLFLNDDNSVSYHYLCSDSEIVQFIPDFEVAFHAGSKINYRSIGIERLVNEKINFLDALHNQAKLSATLMYKWGIPLRRVITHKNARIVVDAIPKQCPSRMLDFQYGGERAFANEIVSCLRNKDFFKEVLNVSLIVLNENKKKK